MIFWTPAHETLQAAAREAARTLEAEHDPRALVRKVTKLPAPSDVTGLCIVREELARRSALADTMFAMQGLGTRPILMAGTDEQKRKYVDAAWRGEKIAAFAITEPEAGSDVAGMRTTARRQGERWLLDGEKTFISNAGIADFYVVFARTGEQSTSAFVVEGGVEATPIQLLADHPIGSLALRGCPAEPLGAEGQGLKIALATLDVFRPTVGAAACGMARRALDEAVARVKSRRQFGKTLAEFQGVQFMLADMATELEAARLLVYQAAALHDGGHRATRQAAMAKLYATEAAQRVIDRSLQLHGGQGLVAGTPTERLYRDIRALRIYEGTSEIQHVVIARDLLR